MRVDNTYTGEDGEQRWTVDLTNEEYESIRKLIDTEMEYHNHTRSRDRSRDRTEDGGGIQFEVGE